MVLCAQFPTLSVPEQLLRVFRRRQDREFPRSSRREESYHLIVADSNSPWGTFLSAGSGHFSGVSSRVCSCGEARCQLRSWLQVMDPEPGEAAVRHLRLFDPGGWLAASVELTSVGPAAFDPIDAEPVTKKILICLCRKWHTPRHVDDANNTKKGRGGKFAFVTWNELMQGVFRCPRTGKFTEALCVCLSTIVFLTGRGNQIMTSIRVHSSRRNCLDRRGDSGAGSTCNWKMKRNPSKRPFRDPRLRTYPRYALFRRRSDAHVRKTVVPGVWSEWTRG